MNFQDLSIDQLAELRDRISATLAERVADASASFPVKLIASGFY